MTQEMPSTLLADLVWWYRLNEASGARLDAHTGLYHLTDTNTVLSAAGQMSGLAADFERGNSEFLTIADAVWNTFGNESVAWWGWFNIESQFGTDTLIGKYDDNNDKEYGIWFEAGNRPKVGVARGGHAWETEAQGASGIIALATWYFGHWYYNATTNLVGLAIYDTAGALVTSGSSANTTGMGTSVDAVAFRIGANQPGGGGTNSFDGLAQQLGCAKIELTANNVQWLINDGNGRDYSELLQGSMPLMF